MRAYRSNVRKGLAPGMTKSRLATWTTLLLLALAAALGLGAVIVERAQAGDSTAVDDGGFNVRVVEEGAKTGRATKAPRAARARRAVRARLRPRGARQYRAPRR